MLIQHAYKSWRKSLLGFGILISAIMFDGSGNLVGFVVDGAGLQFGIQAASSDHTSLRLLKQVMPGADSFSEKEGEVPVYKAYRTDPANGAKTLIGYAVVTSDVQPEPNGYNGPIDSLIGMDLEGNIVGLRVVYYKESLRATWGDFLSEPGFQEQFIGKRAEDGFRVGKDVDGISRATITVKAMSRGVRQTVRAVTKAYLQ